jgi:hypothetical protein
MCQNNWRQQTAQLRRKEKQFKDKGVQVVLMGLGPPEQAEAFRR